MYSHEIDTFFCCELTNKTDLFGAPAMTGPIY